MPSTAPHDLVAQSLARIHTALRRSLETILRVSAQPIPESDRADFAEFCGRFTLFLRTHHDGEEEVVFPKVSEAAKRASLPEYASGVTTWRAEHETLLAHLRDLETAVAAFGKGGPQEPVHRTATAVRDSLLPHLDAEESTLDGPALAKLLPQADEVLAVATAASKHGQRSGGPKVLLLVAHSLTADEQQAHFSAMPWLVRKLLMKRIWARDFRGCLKYAHNPSLAI
jgi:hemerythrin-like domain-containing protein